MQAARRCSQMAWLMARTWSSLKLDLSEEPPVTRSAEDHLLGRVAGLGPLGVIGRDQPRDVGQPFGRGRLACQFVMGHGRFSLGEDNGRTSLKLG